MKNTLLLVIIFAFQAIGQSNNFLTVSQISDYEIVATVENEIHFNYGFAYPLTYQITIPQGSADLKASSKEKASEAWIALEEKTADDFFNGINAVRFDYNNSTAYVSVAFGGGSDAIHIQITNESDDPLPISFVQITKYYDNRDAVVTSTADDWADYCDFKFVQCCKAFRKRKLWLSTAIITKWSTASTWNNIQAQLDLGYVEAVSHSRNHPFTPYSNYDSEIAGSKEDIINKLDLPEQFRLHNKEYVYVWVAPYGNYDEVVDSLAGVNNYLAARLYNPDYHSLPEWDEKSNKFVPFGVSLEIGPTEIDGNWWMGTDDIDVLNFKFDSVATVGGVYHAVIHPNTNVYTKDYFYEHLDYISNRKNIWYAATGHLYLYHFAQIHSGIPAFVAKNSELTPQTTVLHQNYPNPFNPTTTISYTLSKHENIKLTIFNTLGQQVTTIIDEPQSPGFYKIQWDASNNNSGVYIYQLKGETFILNGKMILLQ